MQEVEKVFEAIVGKRTDWLDQYSEKNFECADGEGEFIYDAPNLNDQRYLNRHFIAVNKKLKNGGLYLCHFDDAIRRRDKLYKKYGLWFGRFIYFFDFSWHRACPKLKLTKKFYFWVNRKVKRVYVSQEVLGRLYYCGFEIVEERVINQQLHYLMRKVKEPSNDEKPSYSLIIKMPRIGKNGEIIEVHKVRTMYAYSEYLQEYVYMMNGLADGGKLSADFRITGWGKYMRKLFLDELPMLFYNCWWKHNMKFIGVRPLTRQYYGLYTPEMQQYRIKTKPGVFPPFYADMPDTLEEIQASEKRYLDAYFKHPFATDWKYFWKIVNNIVFRHKHSN